MSQLYRTLLYQPILNLLIFLYNVLPIKDMGIAIVLLTIIIRIVLWPLSKKQIQVQKRMRDLQPHIEEINKKHKDNPQQKNLEIFKLYKENKANPASSCITLLIQLPVLLAMFSVFRDGLDLTKTAANLYSFIPAPSALDTFLLNIRYFNLTAPNLILTLLTAVVQFWQSKMTTTTQPSLKTEASKDESMQAMLNKQMLYIMPIITIIFGMRLPSGIMLYWLISTLLMGMQQWWEFKRSEEVKAKS